MCLFKCKAPRDNDKKLVEIFELLSALRADVGVLTAQVSRSLEKPKECETSKPLKRGYKPYPTAAVLKEQAQEVGRLLKEGKTINEIATILNLRPHIVYHRARMARPEKKLTTKRLKPAPKSTVANEMKKVVGLIKKGLKPIEVARELRMSESTVNNRIHKARNLGALPHIS